VGCQVFGEKIGTAKENGNIVLAAVEPI